MTLTTLFDFEEKALESQVLSKPKDDNPGCPHRCGTCCRLVGFRVEGMSPRELHWMTTRGIFVWPEDDFGFMVVFQQDCIMLSGTDCRLHEGGKPEVCRKAECLRGVPGFDAASKHYFGDKEDD